jgi:hypothetical protein
VQFVGAVGVEDQVVDQAEFEALEDDFGSDGSYGQDGDAGQAVLSGSEGTAAEVGLLDAGPTLVDRLDVLAVGFVGRWIDDEDAAQVAERSPAQLGQVDVALPEEFDGDDYRHVRQLGIRGVVTALYNVPCDQVWPLDSLVALRKRIEAAGCRWKR